MWRVDGSHARHSKNRVTLCARWLTAIFIQKRLPPAAALSSGSPMKASLSSRGFFNEARGTDISVTHWLKSGLSRFFVSLTWCENVYSEEEKVSKPTSWCRLTKYSVKCLVQIQAPSSGSSDVVLSSYWQNQLKQRARPQLPPSPYVCTPGRNHWAVFYWVLRWEVNKAG